MSDVGRGEAREELRQLVALLRTHLQWHLDTGSFGFPRALRGAGPPGEPRSSAPAHPASTPPLPAGLPESEAAPALPAPRPPSELAPAPPAPPPPSESAPPASAELLQSERPPSVPRAIPAEAPPGVQPQQLDVDVARLESAHAKLGVIRDRVAACTACRLHETRTNSVFARGLGSSGLCFVGEGPGADEDAQGVPFVGAAGQLLDRMISAMGMTLDEIYICNIVKCRPPRNRKPAPDEMLACRDYLEEQIAILDPVVIVALGATAVQGLLGTSEGITRLRGRWRLYQGRIAIMPTFHPAYLLRNPAAKRDVWEDLKAVLRQMGRPIPERGR